MNAITERLNIRLRASEPENSRRRTIEFLIYESRGNVGRCPTGRDPVSSRDIPPTVGKDEKGKS